MIGDCRDNDIGKVEHVKNEIKQNSEYGMFVRLLKEQKLAIAGFLRIYS